MLYLFMLAKSSQTVASREAPDSKRKIRKVGKRIQILKRKRRLRMCKHVVWFVLLRTTEVLQEPTFVPVVH